MNPIACFWLIFVILLVCIAYCDNKFCMLKDLSTAEKQPYSWSRVQLAWWTLIIMSAFISIMILDGQAPELRLSTVILLGISAATIATARSIDTSEQSQAIVRHQDKPGENFVIDILSDQSGVSIHRFQTVVFNLAFGVWFISQVTKNLHSIPTGGIDDIMPDIEQNNLILLGLSSATYAVMKTTENKGNAVTAVIPVAAVATVTPVIPVDVSNTVIPDNTAAAPDASTDPDQPPVN